MTDPRQQFLEKIHAALEDAVFLKMTLGAYKGTEKGLKSLLVRPVLLKDHIKLQCTYRFATKDVVKNETVDSFMALLEKQIAYGAFRHAALFSTREDATLEFINASRILLKTKQPSQTLASDMRHNREKQRPISTGGKHYLHALGITNSDGGVKPTRQDKYRQINQYIETIRPHLERISKGKPLHVVDMGSGKGYLTFALYDFLTNTLHHSVEMTGVEFRRELVDICTRIARDSSFHGLHFEEGTIEQYTRTDTDILIALHACDTATDDAIAHGVRSHSELIIVSPCCHKQIRREMQKAVSVTPLDFVTKHGIFMEREAEMVTDALRALILEYAGYKVKIVQFIEDAHTPKNILIIAEKHHQKNSDTAAILQKIQEAKAFFGIEKHYLEDALGAAFMQSPQNQ